MIAERWSIIHSTYGGDTVYEVVKVLEAWKMTDNAYLWTTVKYLARAGKKDDRLEDLKKARWYLDREITNIEKEREDVKASGKTEDR